MVQTTSDTSLAIDSPQGRKLFVFDRVFGPEVQQEGMWDYLADSITSFTKGYNVSLLAYGQSGAGKSYTMGTSGPLDQQDPHEMGKKLFRAELYGSLLLLVFEIVSNQFIPGVVPRAATALFDKLESMYGAPTPSGLRSSISMSSFKNPRGYGQRDTLGDRNWSLKATYVEIYNEQLRDLLAPDGGDRSNVAIREDKGNIILTGLQQVEINSVEDLMNALNMGSTIRQTDSTAINAKSSRSHAVFSLNLIQRKTKLQTNGADKRYSMPIEAMTGQEVSVTTDSKLHFVDLAGSERLKNTGAQGERAKEGISINAGLASLGKVISQLSSRQAGSYVSYRDSKLTRLLQDSLGGNAITYMIACVTPPEFHLSETLNTVQYAQRARAIQSKPKIQQVEEGDKQAVIDRLKAEVSFLREQIRSAQNSSTNGSGNSSNERSDRQNEREAELQNQLLDMQENYGALSTRHAKLIAEMAKAGDDAKRSGGDDDKDGINDATDRLNRSNSFAQAVEQVVLEYEKTIESLEHSLSSTRTTLSTTETTLLERETKCAYVETINGQLQSRLQKLIDREASTENYLHDLESKLDGHTSGEEKNATIILELRKEIARIRENEASCEDYISTLEERLAEADQDAELMQREVDRLEQVVERQRSLGKLDSLLYELDKVEEIKQPEPEQPKMNAPRRAVADHSRNLSLISRHSQMEDPIPEADEDSVRPVSRTSTVKEHPDEADEAEVAVVNGTAPADNVLADDAAAAQSKFVADKLESVTDELVSLRVEHETTMSQYDALQLKYEEAMRTVSQLQDTIDEARHKPSKNARDSLLSTTSESAHRPQSFQSDRDASEPKEGTRSSASRSLSSELSSAMESADTVDTDPEVDVASEDDAATTKPATSSDSLIQPDHTELTEEIERLRALAAENESTQKALASKYAQLESEHSEALDTVEELKTNLSKARAVESVSPKASSPVIRRKSSQNLLIIDRAHRSFASLRNIASENFEERPDVMQSFELNINAAMHELHLRSERIQELEASVAATKKEMETKMTIISGLTRERTSLKASPMDITMVATLRDKLEQHEKQLMDMKESHNSREQELMTELESLREASKAASPEPDAMPNESDLAELRAKHDKKVADLQSDLVDWETKHQTALASVDAAHQESRETVQRLEEELSAATKSLEEARGQASTSEETIRDMEKKHQDLIKFLRSEIDEYKEIIHTHTTKVATLEKDHAAARSELEEVSQAHAAVATEVSQHKELVSELQAQIAKHGDLAQSHEEAISLLKTSHSKELSDLKQQEQKDYEEQVEVLLTEHAESIRKLEIEATDAREDLMKVAAQVATALGLDVSIEKLTERIDGLVQDQRALEQEQHKNEEISGHVAELSTINEKIMEELESTKQSLAELANATSDAAAPALISDHVATIREKMTDLESRNEKSSRLVEELEEQLQHNFDEAQVANKRLSSLQSERVMQLDEANAARTKLQADLDSIREDYSSLQAKLEEAQLSGGIQRSDSNSTIRHSASHGSLPSPPPAIPLPPLPMSPTGTRPMSRDNLTITQITEDQEARIRTIEKHLYAERQLTQTLEEALSDLEKQSKKVKSDCDSWKKRAQELEGEVRELKDRPAAEAAQDQRWSMLAVEEERKKRQAAEAARMQLEERMNAISKNKKKKGSLNCF